ncbi:AAA family ATPase [Streptomyces rubiginosohelvolus]|uniref:AAA family ATPase n=1 Tax=Streptomyces rubiginosohelvolus TaxID=67362 RepID=UPI0036FF5B25
MTTNMDRPPVATTEGQQIHQTNTATESRDLAAVQGTDGTATSLFDYLWDERPGWVCLATDHRIRDIKSKTKASDFRNAVWYSWPEDRSKIWAYAEQVMNSREVWFTPALLQSQDRKATNATANGRICQVDADHTDEWTEEQVATRLALLVKLNAAVVKSGTNGNFHAYIKLDRDVRREVIDGLNAQLTAAFAGDSTKENASSVLRMPGTFNHKTDPSNTVVLERLPEGFPGWDPAELASLLPEAQKTPTEGRNGAIVRREPAAVPDSLDDCRTLADYLSLPTGHPERGNNWLAKVAGFEARDVQSYETLLAKLRAYNAASDDPMGDDQVQKVAESIWSREQLKKQGASAGVLAAKLRSGELSVAEAVEAWDEFDEKVFNDVAGMYIRDMAKARYFDGLSALFKQNPEEYDQTPYAQMQLFDRAAWHRADEQAKVMAAPGNKELGRPSRRSDCAGVVHDTTAPGLFLQAGWISLFMADYEVGKTMVLYSLAVDRLRKGEEVVIIQEDESPDQTWGKFDAFCLTEDEESRLQPYNYQGWNLVANPEMLDRLIEAHPETTLVIVDSVAKLLRLAGLEEDNAGSLALWTTFERFIAKYPKVAVALIDHQGHAGGGHARGATVKAQQSSVVVQLASVTKFAKDRDGQIKAKIHKHRNGESTGHTWRGDVIVRDGDVPLHINWSDEGVKTSGGGKSAETESGVDGIKGAELGILKLLKPTLGSEDVWVTKTDIDKADGRHGTTVGRSISKLIEAGYLAEKPGWKPSDGAKSYRRLK